MEKTRQTKMGDLTHTGKTNNKKTPSSRKKTRTRDKLPNRLVTRNISIKANTRRSEHQGTLLKNVLVRGNNSSFYSEIFPKIQNTEYSAKYRILAKLLAVPLYLLTCKTSLNCCLNFDISYRRCCSIPRLLHHCEDACTPSGFIYEGQNRKR